MAEESTSSRHLDLPTIEVFANEYPEREYTITISMPEYTSVCPRTGLPDFGEIVIDYVPEKTCIELKSLKFYIIAYRNIGIYYEHAVNRILDDIVKAADPRHVKVVGTFNSRGGIGTKVEARYVRGVGTEHASDPLE